MLIYMCASEQVDMYACALFVSEGLVHLPIYLYIYIHMGQYMCARLRLGRYIGFVSIHR
jgi:hypothetical protein